VARQQRIGQLAQADQPSAHGLARQEERRDPARHDKMRHRRAIAVQEGGCFGHRRNIGTPAGKGYRAAMREAHTDAAATDMVPVRTDAAQAATGAPVAPALGVAPAPGAAAHTAPKPAHTNVTLRPMAQADCRAVAALIRTAFAAQPMLTDPPPSALRETAVSVAAHLAAGGGAVAWAGQKIVGSVMWQPKDGGLYIQRLAVAPPWRGGGIARALIAATEAAAHRAGQPRLHLGSRLVLTANRRLFASCGFVEVALHAHPGYAAPTSVQMEKRLEPPGSAL
jgi:predicted N-acetyltransferase YhbS